MVLVEWSFLVIVWLQNGAYAFTVNIGETRVCRSDMKDISGFPRDGSYEILLNTFGHNCTHIYGNLILTDLYILNDGSDPDLNFLRSIREITGYLIIMHSNVAAIPLSNLRVIRAQNGGYQIRPNAKPAALIVRQNYKNGYPLRQIDLRNLRSIVQGSVYVYDNPGLCQWPDQIDWSELFEHPTEQHVFRSDDSSENGMDLVINRTFNSFYFNEVPPLSLCGSKKCAQNCVPVNGNRYCWGSAHADCQHHVSCDQLVCDRCFVQGNHTGCCHEQCLGGCFGPLPTQCEVCREFNNSGTCVSHCPHPLYSQSGSGSELKYRLGNLCVSECPAGFLIEHTACVTHCTYPGMHIVGRTCQLCDGPCPKTCELEQVRSKNGIMVQLIGAPALRSLSGCTRLNGNLVLSTESFYPSTTVPDHEPITAVSQLWALHSLREVTGYVYMDLGFFGPALKNLSFLENLVKVSGVFSLSQASIMIMNSMAREPGLRSLREVPHGQVVFHNNSHMCYLETLPWLPMEDYLYDGDQDLRIIVKLGADHAQCYRSGARCHSDCDLHGCWGPRPDQCVRCRHLRAGPHLCVPTCDALPGYRPEPIVMNASLADVWPQFARRWQEDARFRESVHTGPGQPDSAHVCIPCHPECRQSCSGPAADECIGGCKTAWYNGFCVPECPRDTYLNIKQGICEPCHTHCHPREASQQTICTGPAPSPGPGGCNKCEKFLFLPIAERNNETRKDSETETFHVTCLRGDCPVGTYLSTELIHPSTNTSLSVQLSHMAETRTHMVPVCRPCHPLCKQCSAYSLVRSNSIQLGCIECRGWWFRDTCVEQCPTLDTYMILETNITNTAAEESASNQLSVDHPTATATGQASADTWVRFRGGHCLACHPECQSGCWNAGFNHCYRCSHFRIHFALLSASTVVNKTDAKTFTSNWIGLEDHAATSGKVQFICVSQCPPELPYHVKHPSTDEQICHTRPRLSSAQRDQLLLEEGSVSGVDQIARVKNLTNSSLLWISGLLLLLTAFILCCCCCLRLRVRAWSKQRRGQQQLRQQHPVRSFGARLGLKLAAALRRKTMAGTFEQMIPWHDETIECQTFISQSNGQTKRETTCTSTSSCSHAYSTNMSGPNLGRLVMINSDDLILDKQCGPLGTGAFGAVYRGLWRVQSLHEDGLGYAQLRSGDDAENTAGTPKIPLANRPQSIQSCGTQSTGLTGHTATTDEESAQPWTRFGTEQTHQSHQLTTSSLMRPGRFSEQRMLRVAVKILNDNRGPNDLQALLDEAKVMASVYHKHCLPLLGVCLSQTRKCLVSAYVINGSLDRYLRVHEPDLPEILLLDWASQIADGMAYLQSRGIIHRDLATRNVLVTTREHLQITDFGLAKMLEGEDEVKRGEVVVRSGRVPMRWLAIETLTHGRYSFKTDVWAYGVTIWEIFTFGEKPYDQIETAQVKTHILSGGRLPQPDMCTLELYQVMIRCWNDDPEERPNFNELYEMFANFVQQPNLYLHSRTTSSIATGYPEHSSGGDTRSRTTLYPSFHLLNDRSNGVSTNQVPSPNVQASLASNSTYGSGNQLNGAQSTRHFDPRRRTRCSLLQSVMISPNGRLPRYQAQKRRSTCVPSEHTLSTSLSRTSSAIGDPWNQNNPAHHSHPILAETNGPQLNNPINRRFGLPTGTTALSHAIHPFHAGLLLSTDSRTSSGQPLLSSDQDSSLSQLVLSNLGYNSSESRSSMIAPNASSRTTEVEQQGPSEPTVPQSESGTEPRACSPRTINSSDTTAMQNNMPTNFEIEAAAGYVWPQWPAVFSQTATADVTEEGADPEQEHARSLSPPQQFGVHGDMDDNFPFLNRQLWLRRSARQRQYYLRQWQIHRSAMGMALPELATEEAIAENENTRSPTEDSEAEPGSTPFGPDPDMNESDAEDPTERYCPDPTSSPGTLER